MQSLPISMAIEPRAPRGQPLFARIRYPAFLTVLSAALCIACFGEEECRMQREADQEICLAASAFALQSCAGDNQSRACNAGLSFAATSCLIESESC